MKAEDFARLIEAVENDTSQGYDGIEPKVMLYEKFINYAARGANQHHLRKIANLIVSRLDIKQKVL